jgi:hypothetical protein
MSETPHSRRGRRPVYIDLEDLEKLSALQCTDEEIAGWFEVSTRTIENRRKKPEFATVMERGRARGRVSVRRAQMKMLEGGNGTMGIWLGKQILGQRDVITNEHSGLGGAPIQLVVAKPVLSRLSDQDLTLLRMMVQKLAGEPEDSSSQSPAQDAGAISQEKPQ